MSASQTSARRGLPAFTAPRGGVAAADGGPVAAGGDAPPARRDRLVWGLRFEEPERPRRRLAWLILALVAAALFAGLAIAIGDSAVQRQDLQWLTALHTRLTEAGAIRTADEVADFISQWLGPGPHLLPLTALAAFLAYRAGRLRLALFVPLAFALGVLGESLLKSVVDRARPNLYPDMAVSTGPAFPSGHAVGAVCAVAVPLLVIAWVTRERWLRVSLVVLAVAAVVAIDLARLVLAVHWPTDVVAGNLVGLAICGALAAVLGLPLPGTRGGAGPTRLLTRWWDHTDPDPPTADHGVEGNRRLTSVVGFVQIGLLAVVILSGVVFGSVPVLHLFAGFVAIPLTVLKLGSTGYRAASYYLGRGPYRSAGPPTVIPRLLSPLLVISAVIAFATGVALFAMGTTHGTVATLHTDSAVVFIVLVLAHVAVHARSAWSRSAAELNAAPAVRGSNARWATLLAVAVVGLVLAAGLTIAYPWSV
jgi:membrane-associated phospholipid phosphatase